MGTKFGGFAQKRYWWFLNLADLPGKVTSSFLNLAYLPEMLLALLSQALRSA